MAKNLIPICTLNFVIKDPFKKLEAKNQIKILLEQLFWAVYCCPYSSQMSERSGENWGSLFDLKKGWRMDRRAARIG